MRYKGTLSETIKRGKFKERKFENIQLRETANTPSVRMKRTGKWTALRMDFLMSCRGTCGEPRYMRGQSRLMVTLRSSSRRIRSLNSDNARGARLVEKKSWCGAPGLRRRRCPWVRCPWRRGVHGVHCWVHRRRDVGCWLYSMEGSPLSRDVGQ